MDEDNGGTTRAALRAHRGVNIHFKFGAINALVGQVLSYFNPVHAGDGVDDALGSQLLNPGRVFQLAACWLLRSAWHQMGDDHQEHRGQSSIVPHVS